MELMDASLPTEDLVRAVYPGIELKRSADDQPTTMFGYFCVFNQWAEINSIREGHFLERFAPGCFSKTLKENRRRIQVLFDHGEDPSIGKKVLGPISVLIEDGEGAYYEVSLLNTSYNQDLIEGLIAGLYGSSFRFAVVKEDFVMRPKPSAWNPRGLPERTVTEARLKEFGPVPFPVYAGATSGVRSMTDEFYDRRPQPKRTTSESDDSLYKRSVDFVGGQVWAIRPEKLETIMAIVAERASGYKPSEEEIKERIGARSQDPEVVDDGPVRVINITGTIMPHATLFSQFSGGGSIEDLQAELRAAVGDESVKAILLNIDSPGGAVSLVPEFGDELRAARDVKPVYAVANTMAASAAYWLGSQATQLSVTPSGEVGSIGVITAHQDISKALEREGIVRTTVTAGKYKGELSPFEPLSDEAKNRLQQEVDAYYGMFVDAVAKGRNTSVDDVNANFGQGRMVMAKEAVKLGMADKVESFDQAFARLSKKYTPAVKAVTSVTASTQGTSASGTTYVIQFPTTGLAGTGSTNIVDKWDKKFDAMQEAERSEDLNADSTEEIQENTVQTSEDVGTVTVDALVDNGAGNAHSSATSREASTDSGYVSTHTEEKETEMANQGMTIEEVVARLDEIKARQKEIVAEFGTDPFTDAVQTEWASMIPEKEDLLKRVEDHKMRQAILREYNAEADETHVERETTAVLDRPASTTTRRGGRNAKRIPDNIYAVEDYRNLSGNHDELNEAYRDGAMRAIEVAHFAHPDAQREDVQGHVARLLDTADDDSSSLARRILTTGSPIYQRAFSKYLAGSGLTAEEQRSLSLTGSAGGYAVPIVIDPTVILTSNGVVNPVRQLARVETIVGNSWTGVSSAGVSAAYSAEATETTDNAPTFSQPTANVEKAQAFIPFSIEIGEDWGALQSEMARLLQDAKDTLESNKFLSGAGHGSNVPEGLLVGATAVSTSAATATFAVADIYSLETALAPRWRPRAKIVANRAQYNRVRQFDTAGGASLWVQLQVAAPPTLIGYPAYEWSDMSSATTTGASIMTIGDFSQFLILDRVGMNIELVPHLLNVATNRPDGTRGLYAYWRNTSKVLTNAAFKTLKLL